jgi:hypothetical protein
VNGRHNGLPQGRWNDVKTTTSLVLIALGAVFAFAVNGHPSWLNIQVVGWVIMFTGAAGLLVPQRGYNAVRRRVVRRRTSPGGLVTEVDEQRLPPYITLNSRSVTETTDDLSDLVTSRDDNAARPAEIVEEYLDS